MKRTVLTMISLAAFALPAAAQPTDIQTSSANAGPQVEIPEGAYEIALPNLRAEITAENEPTVVEHAVTERHTTQTYDNDLSARAFPRVIPRSTRYRVPDLPYRRGDVSTSNLIVAHAASTGDAIQEAQIADPVDQYQGPQPGDPASVDTRDAATAGYALANAAPNVVSTSSTISFTIARGGHTQLAIYDNAGRLVSTIVDESLDAGTHTRTFDASHLPTGHYLYRLSSGAYAATKTMSVVR